MKPKTAPVTLTRKKLQAKKIIQLLKKEYPERKAHLRFNNPLNLLVATILSAQCTDKMVNKVTPHLFKKYKKVRDYAESDMKSFTKEIQPIGLYKSKAKNIKKMAKKIIADFDGKVPNSIDKLILLPGVGRKTANIVLHHAFNKNEGIAVDTHVGRISKRLGLTDNDQPAKIEPDLMSIVPKKDWGLLNYLLVTHGKIICRARNPLHSRCAVRNHCRWYKENYDEKTQ